MADVYTDIDNTLDVEVNFDNAPQDINAEEQATDGIQVGAQPEQLLSLIGANERLAATNARLADEILPTLRGGLQTKEVAPADIEQVITPDDGYLGLQRVKVAPYEREVQVVNHRANESEFLYYMEDIATQYQRSDYAVCMAGEFYKDADTTILAGADAYLTSDGDFYTAQTTHTWHDDDDIHANRWIVYYFKQGENKSNFMIVDATACPNVLAVKGHLGAIIANIAVSIRDIIIGDDSSVQDIRVSNTMWKNTVVLNNVHEHTSTYLLQGNNIAFAEIRGLKKSITPNGKYQITAYGCRNLRELILPDLEEANGCCVYGCANLVRLHVPKLKSILAHGHAAAWSFLQESKIDTLYLPELESAFATTLFESGSQNKIIAPKLTYISVSRLFQFSGINSTLTKIVFGSVTTNWTFSFYSSGKFGALIHFEFGADGGAGLSASLNLYCWTCSAIDLTAGDLVEDKDKFTTNKEQLLYNFKTYTIERLQNRTDMSKLTLTIGTYLYNIVTQETDDSLTDGVPYGEWLTAKLAEINWSLASA